MKNFAIGTVILLALTGAGGYALKNELTAAGYWIHTSDRNTSLKRKANPFNEEYLQKHNFRLNLIQYGSHERQYAFLFTPTDGNHTPLVVLVHGGGWKFYDAKASDNISLLPNLIETNFSVLLPNYRYSIVEEGGKIVERNPHPSQIEDIRAAEEYVTSRAEKLGIGQRRAAIGFSAGAHLAALRASEGNFDAVVVYGGIYEFGIIERADEGERAEDATSLYQMTKDLFGGKTAEEWDALVKDASPITHLNKKTRWFIRHGRDDRIVPVEQAIVLKSALDEIGANYDFQIISGGHAAWTEEDKRKIIDFLSKSFESTN